MVCPPRGEHKTVQARILAYAQEIGWTYVSRAEAEARRGLDPEKRAPAEQAADASPYFGDLLDAQVRLFNPKYAEGPGALVGELRHLHATIAGNRDFLAYLRNARTFYDHQAGRELNLVVIDYDQPERNVFEVTEEYYCHNGTHGTREDVVFLINGIPVLVIECKNSTKDEAIALGVDQVRRYHRETPELFVPQMVFTATEAIGFSYGVTWNLIRRNIFNWKDQQKGNLEAKVKSFCSPEHVLALLKDYILFAEKDEELQKFILRQHQTTAVEVNALDQVDHLRVIAAVFGHELVVSGLCDRPTRSPFRITTRTSVDEFFRGSITQLQCSLSTLRRMGSPHHHARLASGCRPGSTGWDCLPIGLLRKVSGHAILYITFLLSQASWRTVRKTPRGTFAHLCQIPRKTTPGFRHPTPQTPMGITIHYRGSLADLSRVEDFEYRFVAEANAISTQITDLLRTIRERQG